MILLKALSKMESYERSQVAELARRVAGPRRFIQVVAGPRQAGKTTLVHQAMERMRVPVRYASADEPTLRGPEWIAQQWEAARLAASGNDPAGVLVLDEIQKMPGWSETVKRLWDEDKRAGRRLAVVLLGSAPLLLARGLTESLAGRFETLPVPHWSYAEMKAAFGWTLDEYLFHGGYPGAAPLIREPSRWSRYVCDSLIETSIARDVLLLSRVDKPALLRRLFELACRYSGQVLSYSKMLGQLQDAGNTTTLAHYLELLAGAGMLMLFRHRASLGGFNVLVLYLQDTRGWRAGHLQMGLDCGIVLAALAFVPLPQIAWSVAGAVALNLTLAINHRPGRYMAV